MDNSTIQHHLNDSRAIGNSTLFDQSIDSRTIDNSTIIDNKNDGIDNNTLLARLNEEYMMIYAPVFVYFSLVQLFGIVGNCFNFIFYGFKGERTPQTAFIAALALIDMMSCVGFVAEYVNLASTLTYTSVIGCKISTFFLQFFTEISYLTLWLMSIDRYIMMCKPKWRQFSLTSVIVGIGILMVTALCLSIPHLFWRGISTVTLVDHDNNPITVHYCSERSENPIGRMIYKVVAAIVVVLIGLTFLILYLLIGHKHYVTSRSETKDTSDNLNVDSSVIPTTRLRNDNASKNASEEGSRDDNADSNVMHMALNASDEGSRDDNADSSVMHMTLNASEVGSRDYIKNDHIVNKIANISKIEWQFTLMVFMMTTVMVVSLVPVMVVNIMTRLKPITSDELSAGMQMMWRTYMMAHAINPYIIACFNKTFRKRFKQIFCKCRSARLMIRFLTTVARQR